MFWSVEEVVGEKRKEGNKEKKVRVRVRRKWLGKRGKKEKKKKSKGTCVEEKKRGGKKRRKEKKDI